MSRDRLPWIDNARGLGMILVLLGHAPLPEPFGKYVYTFHIPFFFFLSGYLFSIDRYPTCATFCLKKFKSLFVPYCALSLMNYICWVLLRGFTSRPDLSIYKPLIGILYALRGSVWSMCSGPLWFVACLLCAESMFFIVVKYSRGNLRKIALFLVCASLLGYFYSTSIGIPLPWSFDAAFTAVVFYGAGYIAKTYRSSLDICAIDLRLVAVIALFGCIVGMLNARVDMAFNRYGNYFLFYVSAFSGIAALLAVVYQVLNVRILAFIGENSLAFLGLHQFVLYNGFDRIAKYFNVFNSANFLLSATVSVFYVVAVIIILTPVVFGINRYVPQMVGKGRIMNRRIA